jgi:predicted LPLAT superfamily acyltransferase
MSESEWDGRSKGSLTGYKIFVSTIYFLGLPFAYFFCHFVSFYFLIFGGKTRSGLMDFYKKSFKVSGGKAFRMSRKTFYNFGVSLIDRFGMLGKRADKLSFDVEGEEYLKNIIEAGKGGILVSAHLGNWEIGGNKIHERVSSCINIVTLDNEVEKIKEFIEMKTGGPKYNIIPIKEGDISHLIAIKQALDRNELIAVHADRSMKNGSHKKMDFLNNKANFSLGPFILASKLKVPVAFVFGIKTGRYHYTLTALDAPNEDATPDSLLDAYVNCLEGFVKKYPTQWYNFFNYYVD